jgi:hypothetical protein
VVLPSKSSLNPAFFSSSVSVFGGDSWASERVATKAKTTTEQASESRFIAAPHEDCGGADLVTRCFQAALLVASNGTLHQEIKLQRIGIVEGKTGAVNRRLLASP